MYNSGSQTFQSLLALLIFEFVFIMFGQKAGQIIPSPGETYLGERKLYAQNNQVALPPKSADLSKSPCMAGKPPKAETIHMEALSLYSFIPSLCSLPRSLNVLLIPP